MQVADFLQDDEVTTAIAARCANHLLYRDVRNPGPVCQEDQTALLSLPQRITRCAFGPGEPSLQDRLDNVSRACHALVVSSKVTRSRLHLSGMFTEPQIEALAAEAHRSLINSRKVKMDLVQGWQIQPAEF